MNVSKVVKGYLCETQTGTPYYASPEIWKDHPYSDKADVWSLGCILYEMITLNPPFMAESMDNLYKKIIKGIYPKIEGYCSNSLKDAIRKMLQVKIENRPTVGNSIYYFR